MPAVLTASYDIIAVPLCDRSKGREQMAALLGAPVKVMVCFIWVLICKKVQFFVHRKSN